MTEYSPNLGRLRVGNPGKWPKVDPFNDQKGTRNPLFYTKDRRIWPRDHETLHEAARLTLLTKKGIHSSRRGPLNASLANPRLVRQKGPFCHFLRNEDPFAQNRVNEQPFRTKGVPKVSYSTVNGVQCPVVGSTGCRYRVYGDEGSPMRVGG